jgi:hypothetical protein
MEEDAFSYIPNYKTNEPLESIEEFPVPSSERIPTDVFCTVITSIFAIAMLGTAIASLDLNNLQKMTYPTDQEGRHCTLDNANYNYLYFTSSNDPVLVW